MDKCGFSLPSVYKYYKVLGNIKENGKKVKIVLKHLKKMMSICLFKTYRNNFIIRNFYMNHKTKIFIYQKLNICK